MEAHAIQPALIVLECCTDVSPLKLFDVVGVCPFEATLNVGAFMVGQELGCGWIVVDEKISKKCYNDGKETFL